MHQQLVILGGGPGGYAAAFLAASRGIDVALVDPRNQLGGTCLLEGCIPSKALLHTVRVMAEVEQLERDWGVSYGQPQIDLDKLRERKQRIITNLGKGLAMLATKRQLTLLQATARLTSSSSLQLTPAGGAGDIPETLDFDHCILATGSVPQLPAVFDVESPRVMDSTAALELTDVPQRLLVVGGGYIGLELGSVYARLGSQVSLVEMTDQLLPGVDPELVKPLARMVRRQFESCWLSSRVEQINATDQQVEVTIVDSAGESRQELFDRVLVATGRRPASQQLGLENTAATIDDDGFVVVDDQMQTADPHLLAIGDLAGQPMLAHKATADARRAVAALLGDPAAADRSLVPAVIFTDPEIAWVGQQAGDDEKLRTVSFPWGASGRAQAIGRIEGLTRWTVDAETGQLLGCGLVGPGAGELIAEAVVAIQNGLTADQLADAIHPHPTLSETLAGAADIYLGQSIEGLESS